jgi:hypothetical protein
MGYSNGYDVTAVYAALENRIGFRQPDGAGAPVLTGAVTTTNSGRYFQDFHSLLTVENIRTTMELAAASDAQLITHLQNIRKAAIMRALNGVFTGKQVIDQVRLYSRYGRNDEQVANTGLFVGYEINVAEKPDAAIQIDSLYVYLDSAITFNIYLFKDGDLAPIMTQAATSVANKITEIAISSEMIIGKGKYYLGYFQNDLGIAKAYREEVDCWARTRMFGYEAISAASTGATTFNRNELSYLGEPIGLNAEFSSFVDHTLQIRHKAAIFDELIGLTLTYSVIEQIVYSARSHGRERILKEQIDQLGIQLELTGSVPVSESPQIMGLKQRIERETGTVRDSFYKKPKAIVVNADY